MKKIIFLFYIVFTSSLYSQEIGGYDIKGKKYSALVEEIEFCEIVYAGAIKNSFAMQLDGDEVEFSDENLSKEHSNILKMRKKMIEAEEILTSKHKNYLREKRKSTRSINEILDKTMWEMNASTMVTGSVINIRKCRTLVNDFLEKL